jgi:chromosome partitioning protein
LRAVAFVSPKGGAGKTTAALALALGLADLGLRVAMIDSDPNRPLVHWAALPGRPPLVTVHPAPTLQDVRDAFREANRLSPDVIILDTEGSLRGATAFMAIRLDLVITPLAGSQLEALQAVKAADMVRQFRSGEQALMHRAVLTRVPAALRPRSLKAVVDDLHARKIEFIPTPLFEKEAFRALFVTGGGFDAVERSGVSGVASARDNVRTYADAVLELLKLR